MIKMSNRSFCARFFCKDPTHWWCHVGGDIYTTTLRVGEREEAERVLFSNFRNRTAVEAYVSKFVEQV